MSIAFFILIHKNSKGLKNTESNYLGTKSGGNCLKFSLLVELESSFWPLSLPCTIFEKKRENFTPHEHRNIKQYSPKLGIPIFVGTLKALTLFSWRHIH